MGRIPDDQLDARAQAMLAELHARRERAELGQANTRRHKSRGALSRIRMRTLLLPAFAIVLMVHFGSRAGAPLGVQAAFSPGTGSSFAGPRVFESNVGPAAVESVRLAPGDVVGATSGTGSVLRLGRGELHLDPGARALVASLMPPRARLIGGTARATGRQRLVTAHGILDLAEGEALLRLDHGGLQLTLVRGAATLTGPDGVLDLEIGRSIVSR